jgi:hypothetical protein
MNKIRSVLFLLLSYCIDCCFVLELLQRLAGGLKTKQ